MAGQPTSCLGGKQLVRWVAGKRSASMLYTLTVYMMMMVIYEMFEMLLMMRKMKMTMIQQQNAVVNVCLI